MLTLYEDPGAHHHRHYHVYAGCCCPTPERVRAVRVSREEYARLRERGKICRTCLRDDDYDVATARSELIAERLAVTGRQYWRGGRY